MSIAPALYDFVVRKGNYGRLGIIAVACLNDDGTPIPMTGVKFTLSIMFQAKRLTKSSADGGLAVDPTTGIVSWTPTQAEVAQIPRGRYASYTWHADYPDGSGQDFMQGYMIGDTIAAGSA